MKKSIILFSVFISIITIIIICICFVNKMFYRPGYGEQYSINWKCSKYKISFTSNDEAFPYKPNEYKGEILNNKTERIIVNIEQGNFSFGVYGEPYTETNYNDPNNYDVYADFEEYASGGFDYDGKTFTVSIIKAKEKYCYLLNKKLIFKKEF